jgi:hypothetical protein
MSRVGQFAATVGLALVSLVLSRALLELVRLYGWYPEQQVARLLFDSPGHLVDRLALWWIVAVLAVVVWASLDHAFHRMLWSRETQSEPASPESFIERISTQTEPLAQGLVPSNVKRAEGNPNIGYVVTPDRTTILVLTPHQIVPARPREASVSFRTDMSLIDSLNVLSITDDRNGYFTITFAVPLKSDKLMCRPIPPTANPTRVHTNRAGARILFEPAVPDVITLRFWT